ncbi:MAG: hypothetical protein HGA19_20040, partial [Oscillochloris sp.]|nr:hypothetical protein [Oscillochloris sp.]
GETWLALPDIPAGTIYTNQFTSEQLVASERGGAVGIAIRDVLKSFPVALLMKWRSTG